MPTPKELLLTPWTMDRERHVMRRADGEYFANDSRWGDEQRQALVDAVNAGVNMEEIQNHAFELGVKSAGGAVVPDRSKFIELAITRSALNELMDFAEAGESAGGGPFSPELLQFFENVSIHRSRK